MIATILYAMALPSRAVSTFLTYDPNARSYVLNVENRDGASIFVFGQREGYRLRFLDEKCRQVRLRHGSYSDYATPGMDAVNMLKPGETIGIPLRLQDFVPARLSYIVVEPVRDTLREFEPLSAPGRYWDSFPAIWFPVKNLHPTTIVSPIIPIAAQSFDWTSDRTN